MIITPAFNKSAENCAQKIEISLIGEKPSMAKTKPSKKRFCNSDLETRALEQYWVKNGGLIFTEFNTTYGFKGKLRALDAIRFPELEKGVFRAFGRYDEIKSLIAKHRVEVIEVHPWGFYGLGQLVGKAEIFEKYWSQRPVNKVLIVLGPHEVHPEINPDPLTEEVFKKLGIEIFVPSPQR